MKFCLLFSIVTLLFLAGNGLNAVSTWYCTFVESTILRDFIDDDSSTAFYGIWLIENITDGTCYLPARDGNTKFVGDFLQTQFYKYNSSFWYQDYYMVFARACGTGALLIGSLSWIIMVIGLCFDWTLGFFFRGAMGAVAIICAVLIGAQFMVLNSTYICETDDGDTECNLGWAGFMNIGAIVVYVLAAAGAFLLPDDM
mmetsp:Transcript_27579/g.40732  ORF Transcript_27579/g.40732 Transcript_27579/m.40732 type:complete len:199 (-) Transcript_27579:194-790(-)